jgi:hypothetical protein
VPQIAEAFLKSFHIPLRWNYSGQSSKGRHRTNDVNRQPCSRVYAHETNVNRPGFEHQNLHGTRGRFRVQLA